MPDDDRVYLEGRGCEAHGFLSPRVVENRPTECSAFYEEGRKALHQERPRQEKCCHRLVGLDFPPTAVVPLPARCRLPSVPAKNLARGDIRILAEQREIALGL